MKRIVVYLILFILFFFTVFYLLQNLNKNTVKSIYTTIYQTLIIQERTQQVSLIIGEKEMNSLEIERKDAIKTGYILNKNKKYVPCNILYNGSKLEAEIKLKGLFIEHLNENKWSFRIKLVNNHLINGINKISLHHPMRRNGIHEWVWHQLLKHEGILAPNYEFINVSINNYNWGLYALEEHFSHKFILSRNLPSGFIIYFDDEKSQNCMANKNNCINETFDVAPIKTYTKIKKGNPLKPEFDSLLQDISLFQNLKIAPSSIFDIEKTSKFLALSDLMAAHHGLGWQNIRFYYDTGTKLLEPIGFDGEPYSTIHELAGQIGNCYKWPNHNNTSPFLNAIFNDTLITNRYIYYLKIYSEGEYLNQFLNNVDADLRKNMILLKSEFPFMDFDKNAIKENQSFIKVQLNKLYTTND